MTTVIFDSVYGSTQRYAQELANQLNAKILPLADAKNQAHLDKLGVDKQPLIVMSPVHGPSITAADFVKKHDFGDRPVAVVVVGMTLLEEARAKDQLAIPLAKKPAVEHFYLPGRLNYSELKFKHKMIMKTMIAALRQKKDRTPNEQNMVDCYERDVDETNFAELAPIVQWAQCNS
ncbi:TPA: hypothetical protein NJT62_000280 [Corynebacterium striatum]|nr:hypothetical protein [Corynebacterium striatum]